MSVDLGVLDSLGINLYSNAAAVLSELVANAYDADATLVDVDWKKKDGGKVVVSDDGAGMTVKDAEQALPQGRYKKRKEEGPNSERFNRPYMGRKGIGKLSVFSIARTITVYSTKVGESNGLEIITADLEEAIEQERAYHPREIPVPEQYQRQGTVLVLEDLKQKRSDLTASALKKRLARRFDVLDQTSRKDGGFYIEVNGKRLTFADRQELKHVEFIWEFGEETLGSETLPKIKERFVLPNPSVVPGKDWRVRGWFGTVGVPSELTTDDEAGSLKNIIVLARKRPIQEGIVEKLDFSRIFGNYVTGQIEADFLDLDDYEDIATSDRQRMMEDDDRVLALRDFLRSAFVKAADDWSKARPKKEAQDFLANHPKMREWVDNRPGWQRDAAETMIGTIASIPMDGKNAGKDKADLFRAGVLAFERVGLRGATDELEKLSTVTAENLLPLLGQQGAYEAGMWVDILRSRVEAIDQLTKLTDEDALEKVLQRHLFDNLWLLDPSWERAAGDAYIEENLKKVAPGLFPEDPEGSEIEGRIDIRYRRTSGQHVIVELKKYSVRASVEKLYEQGLKYRTALADLLTKQQCEDKDIIIMFVLGEPPRVPNRGRFSTDEGYIKHRFDGLAGKYALYGSLIGQARYQYEEYLNASDKAKALDELLGTWGAEFADGDGSDADDASSAQDEQAA